MSTTIREGELDALYRHCEESANRDGWHHVSAASITSAPVKRALAGIPEGADHVVLSYRQDYDFDTEPDDVTIVVVKYADDFWASGQWVRRGRRKADGGMFHEEPPTVPLPHDWCYKRAEWVLSRPLDRIEATRMMHRANVNETALKAARKAARDTQESIEYHRSRIERWKREIAEAEAKVGGELKDRLTEDRRLVRELVAERESLKAAGHAA